MEVIYLDGSERREGFDAIPRGIASSANLM